MKLEKYYQEICWQDFDPHEVIKKVGDLVEMDIRITDDVESKSMTVMTRIMKIEQLDIGWTRVHFGIKEKEAANGK